MAIAGMGANSVMAGRSRHVGLSLETPLTPLRRAVVR